MKKALKRIGLVLLSIIAIVSLFLLISFVVHRIKLEKEDVLFKPIGQLVEVNGHKVNVYCVGEGETTLVFMSGGGTSSPVLDFKSLYSLLDDEYRIVVVEKAGYGFSEVADVKRDVDSVLSETREAISLANIKGPFVLCPHSMSGIEALYWAQKYPEEVSAIIGLDMAVPQSYESYQINMPMINLLSFAANAGVSRWFPDFAESDAIKYGTLSDDEKELYKVIFYRRTMTKTMLSEVKAIKTSAETVKSSAVPETPILIFSSNGEGTGWDGEQWKGFQKDFIGTCINGSIIDLNCAHYVHDIEYNKISEDIKAFFGKLETQDNKY